MNNEVNGDGPDSCGIRILGETRDQPFVDNRIGNSPKRRQKIGILIGDKAGNSELRDNDLSGVNTGFVFDRCTGLKLDTIDWMVTGSSASRLVRMRRSKRSSRSRASMSATISTGGKCVK